MEILAQGFGANIAECKQVSSYEDSLLGNLRRRKQRAETELGQVNEALAALEKNPELAKTLELISKIGR